jgi:hypothetical protein
MQEYVIRDLLVFIFYRVGKGKKVDQELSIFWKKSKIKKLTVTDENHQFLM